MTESGSWTPDIQTVAHANITRFMEWLRDKGRGDYADYTSLWEASVSDIGWFWESIWEFFDVQAATPAITALGKRQMPGAQWFPGATLNYVDQIFRHAADDRPALIAAGEDGATEWSWERLRAETAGFAAYLRGLGVQPGDRVVGYLPNIGEAVVAFLGAAAVGATWAVCNPDLAVDGVVSRLAQLEPTVLVAADGSVYGGKQRDKRPELADIHAELRTLKATVLVPRLGLDVDSQMDNVTPWADAIGAGTVPAAQLEVTPVLFAHPLWVLFSSGTTGTPKGIVHGHGGVLLEHLKYLSLQGDLKPADRFLWQSTTSWILLGAEPGAVVSSSAVDRPELLAEFSGYSRK